MLAASYSYRPYALMPSVYHSIRVMVKSLKQHVSVLSDLHCHAHQVPLKIIQMSNDLRDTTIGQNNLLIVWGG